MIFVALRTLILRTITLDVPSTANTRERAFARLAFVAILACLTVLLERFWNRTRRNSTALKTVFGTIGAQVVNTFSLGAL